MSKIPSKTLLLLLTLLPIFVISQTPPSPQHQILLNINKQWNNQIPTWNSTTPHYCQFPGVECAADSATVTGLLLGSLNLNGTIPTSICDLKNLTKLNLTNNNIIGTFPTVLYNCYNLESLLLSLNYFVGALPNDINKLPSSLKYLDLSYNNFTGGIPGNLGGLNGLVSLHLEDNLFNATIPKELGMLENLQELVLDNNPFLPMKLAEEFGDLRNLQVLRMAECNLIGEIPKIFGNLSSLEMLDLYGNGLEGEIPSGVFLLRNLTYLYLYKNNLSGTFPSLITAVNLVELDVSMNNFISGEIPESITKLHKLEILGLFNNQFNGTLPAGIGRMKSLKKFKIWNNNFHGVIPQDLGLNSRLVEFQVANNGFTGQLPENLCKSGVLTGVVAFNNRLSGKIPSGLGECSTLITVQLYNNEFSGEIPEKLWTLMDLTSLQLSNNQLSGQIPRELARNVTRLEIAGNRLSGKIPSSVSHWGGLILFDASNNMISGSIPLELTSLSELNSLKLSGNQLSGNLPSEIISWESLNTLNLSDNRLSGSIPSVLGSLQDLNYLDLSINQFSGEIPSELANLKLTVLNLSSNKFTGRIPVGLDNNAYSTSYQSTDLCSNGGISDIPKCSNFHQTTKKLSAKYLAIVLVFVLVAFLGTSYFTLCLISEFRRRKHSQDLVTWKLTSFHKLDFTEEKVLANLNESNLIGSGGSGQVYRIPVNRSGDPVAVKRIWNNVRKTNNALEKEFLAEVEILGTIRHSNIVKLLCCISSESSKLLVYEFMENQSLDQWIHESRRESDLSDRPRLDWPARLRVAIGAAQGLSYMHHDCSPPIIHRDVKSSNILLDSKFNAKIADFGLARILAKPGGQPNTVSSVAGSFGYMAPEYCYTTKVNEKIDIFSFGVVLLELVTGKEPQTGDDYSNLAEWAWKYYSSGNPISDILDAQVKEVCYLDEMTNVFKMGLMCTSTLASSRPTMKEVLQVLKRCNVLDGSGRAKTGNGGDASPLLGSVGYVSSCKNSKKGGFDDDEYGMV